MKCSICGMEYPIKHLGSKGQCVNCCELINVALEKEIESLFEKIATMAKNQCRCNDENKC